MRRETKTVAISHEGSLAVGAVYDRASAAFECDKRAVIDRAYRGVARTVTTLLCILWPIVALAQESEGPREIDLPNPMSAHTWFIIAAIGAFLVWCISYVLQLQKERLSSPPQRETLLRQKDELLNRLAQLESQKEAGTIEPQRYDKEFRKARSRLSDVLGRLGRKQGPTET